MTDNCKDIQTSYYAALLAKCTKLGDGDIFSAIHDKLAKTDLLLSEVERRAQDYSELSLGLIECKIKEFSAKFKELDPSWLEIGASNDFSTSLGSNQGNMKVTRGNHGISECLASEVKNESKLKDYSENVADRDGFRSASKEDGKSNLAEAQKDGITEEKDGKEESKSSSKSKKKKKKKKSKKSSSKKSGVQDKTPPTEPQVSNNSSDKSEQENKGDCVGEKVEADAPTNTEKSLSKPRNGIVPTPFGPLEESDDVPKKKDDELAKNLALIKDLPENKYTFDPLDSIQPEISFIIDNLESSIDQPVPLQTDTVSSRSVEFHCDTVTSDCAKLTFDTMPEHEIALPLDNVPSSSVSLPFGYVESPVPNYVKFVPTVKSEPKMHEISTKLGISQKNTQVSQKNENGSISNGVIAKTESGGTVPWSKSSKNSHPIVKPRLNTSGKPPFDYPAAVEFLWNEWIQIPK